MNNGKVFAEKKGMRIAVRFCHWWPGRRFDWGPPMPAQFIRKAQGMGSTYMTYAELRVGDCIFGAPAFCRPRNGNQELARGEDVPTRETGRSEALKKLKDLISPHGWELSVPIP